LNLPASARFALGVAFGKGNGRSGGGDESGRGQEAIEWERLTSIGLTV
jgi:hypothetical protein